LTEFRKDITTNEWVIMARERVNRPTDFETSKKKRKLLKITLMIARSVLEMRG